MTNNIRLRRYRLNDVEAVFAAVMESKHALSRWMPWYHDQYSKVDTTSWVEGRLSAWERDEAWSLLIVDSNDRVLGSGGFHHLDLKNAVGELGYWIRTSVTGRGVATEAAKQLCHWGFEVGKLERIEILASIDNVASQRVAEKAGGIREGILRKRIHLHDCRHDCVLFSILKDQFNS